MKVSVSWLRDYVDFPDTFTGRDVAAQLLRVGFEVESVERVGDVVGQLVVGRVASIEELTDFKKPIRWCHVDVGLEHGAADTPGVRGIVCGARNFEEGDLVVVALPGTTLPGDFTIATRETYGHVSDGMMCSARELGLGDDHSGIIILPAGSAGIGDDAFPILGLGDEVLDVAVLPDRGYAMSLRGLARELSIALGTEFRDPADQLPDLPVASGIAVDAASDDASACDLLMLRTLTGFNPQAPTPAFMTSRLAQVGVRSISLAVDVTNYVMFEIGQPLHAFDADKVTGTIRARRATTGETLETLDHVTRKLSSDDLLIADDNGPLSLAGTMGGYSSEISDSTTRIVIEAAHFDSGVVARMSRRHKLSSESSRRFERGVDRMLPPVASARAAQLLIEFGGATYAGASAVETAPDLTTIAFDRDMPEKVTGHHYSERTVTSILTSIGCVVQESTDHWTVGIPTWRADLSQPVDLVEEVARIDGYDKIPSRVPVSPRGRGLTVQQKMMRRLGAFIAGQGLVEVRNFPFMGQAELDALELDHDDNRRHAVRLANPLSDEQPLMRTTLLPGLVGALARNVSRGFADVALCEIASVSVLATAQSAVGSATPPRPTTSSRPTATDLADIEKLLPAQPRHFSAIMTGATLPAGWWGSAAPYSWRDAIQLVVALGVELGVDISVSPAHRAPWHPGRCASLSVGGQVIGYAGELAPRVLSNLGIPARTVACEVDVDVIITHAQSAPAAPSVYTFPVAKEDVAFVVEASVAAETVAHVIRTSGGSLLEDVRLFDIYQGSSIPDGKKSLAYALRFRASDRTLSSEEITAVREAIVAAVTGQCDAVLRG